MNRQALPLLQGRLRGGKTSEREGVQALPALLGLLLMHELFVLFDGAVIETALDNATSFRHQILVLEFAELLMEEIRQNLRAGVESFIANFRLSVYLQEPARNHAPFNVEGEERVAEQGAAGRLQLA